MNLTETGESRVNGYLFVLERSLKTFLPPEVVRDAVREIESHLRERVLAADGAPNEREALEKILAELGPPLRVAQAYSAERTIDEAVDHRAVRADACAPSATWRSTTIDRASATAFGLFIGYLDVVRASSRSRSLKPIFPEQRRHLSPRRHAAIPIGLGAHFPAHAGHRHVGGGYWVIPFALFCGLGILVGTHRGARRYLAWWRARRVS